MADDNATPNRPGSRMTDCVVTTDVADVPNPWKARAEKAEKEIERLREKSEVLAAEWCREPEVEFAMAAIEMREMVKNPEHQQALAMALVEMQAKLDRVGELCDEVIQAEAAGILTRDDHLATQLATDIHATIDSEQEEQR